jgi:uncharacterized protein (TIGR02391 family)
MKSSHLQALCAALADGGLTGSEIGGLLSECGIEDPGAMTKRYRLFDALDKRQRSDMSANNILAFVRTAMDPARFVSNPTRLVVLRERANLALAFAGYTVDEEGRIRVTSAAKTVDEAVERSSRLRNELQRRGVHPEVLRFCRPELLQRDYFHAILEASKSLAESIREKTGSHGDGWSLVDETFGGDSTHLPKLAFNRLESETDWSEHRGVASMLKGVFSVYRNPPAHIPRINRPVGEVEALDALTVISMLHRRLDEAVRTGPT